MLTVSELFIYPIKKSAGGKAVDSARLTATGFEHDRRWMLIDDNTASFRSAKTHGLHCWKPVLPTTALK